MGYDEPGRGGTDDRDQPGTATGTAVLDEPPADTGRDRVGVHVAWEVALAVKVLVLGLLLWSASPETLRGGALRELLVTMVGVGLLALAAGLSLRTAAPNLAVGPVAVAAALHFAEQGDRGVTDAVVPAAVVAALGGLALALVVVLLRVPAWAATLAGAAAVVVYIERRQLPVPVQGEFDPRHSAWYLFAGFAAVAVLGGLFGTIRSVRRLVGRSRPVTDPARWRGTAAAFVAAGALTGSTVLAVLAGVLFAANGPDRVVPDPGLDWTALAIGMALLGGTSAFGRRGGVSGTLLVVVLVVFFFAYVEAEGHQVSRWAVAGAVLGIGLVVTRLVETYGRPRPAAEPTESGPAGDGTISSGWALPRAGMEGAWPPALPARSTEDPVDPWERWESRAEQRHGDLPDRDTR